MFVKINHSPVPRESSMLAQHFVSEFYNAGKPVILSELMQDWPAREKWDLEYLSTVAGEVMVPVYSSKPAMGKQHQHAAAQTVKLRDYLQMLKDGENDLRIFFYNILKGAPELLKDFDYPDLGIKFLKRLPVLFVGGRGTKVQMHYDIDLADLILCHFGGRKHVLLIPPEQSKYVYKVPWSFSALHEVDLAEPDFERFPALKNINAQVAVLEHGDALFIPSGYWHYIIYEDIGFSMTLRALPTKFGQRLTLLKNIFFTRLIEGSMRKLLGQKWVDRNERLAVSRTHRGLGL